MSTKGHLLFLILVVSFCLFNACSQREDSSENTATANADDPPVNQEDSIASRSFSFTYEATVKNGIADSGDLKLFIPLPQNNYAQNIENLKISSPYQWVVKSDPEFGNTYLYIHHKGELPDSFTVSINFTARRFHLTEKNYDKDSTGINRFLKEFSKVPITDLIRQEAYSVIRPGMDINQKAAAIFEHLINTMRYDKSGEGWGQGDAIFACTSRYGNCTDFHSLFNAEMRALGIPTRFIIGFSIPEAPEGEISGYHCWAEYYDPEKGWVPVDVSEADKHPYKKDELFQKLNFNRIQFTKGRDILIDGKTNLRLNYFIYPYCLIKDTPVETVKYRFSYKNI